MFSIILTDVASNISLLYNWTSLSSNIHFVFKEKFKNKTSRILKSTLNLSSSADFSTCKTLDCDALNVTEMPKEIRLFFKKHENVSIRIIVEEKNKVLKKRFLRKNLLSYIGPDIINDDLSKGKIMNYLFSISQEINSELDEDKHCRIYPTKQYSSFRNCDEKTMHEQFMKSNLMPFYAAENMSDITRKICPFGLKYITTLRSLVSSSSCLSLFKSV